MKQATMDGEMAAGRALLIRVRNAPELARSQGTVAAIAQMIAPSTVEGKVYDEMGKQIQKSLKEKNVDAEVSIVDASGYARPVGFSWTSAAVGVGFASAVAGILYAAFGGKR